MPDPYSLYPKAPEPLNPLTTVSQFANITNQLNQAKQFEQVFAGKQAIGRAYQAGTDPMTGEVDFGRVIAEAAQDPNSNYLLGDLINAAQNKKKQGEEITAAQLTNFKTVNGFFAEGLSSLLARPEITRADIMSELTKITRRAAAYDPEIGKQVASLAITESANLPTDQQEAAKPGTIREALTQYQLKALSALERFNAIGGSPVTVESGGSTQLGYQSPLSGYRPTANLPKTLTPGEASEPTEFVGPSGEPRVVPRSQFLGLTGSNPLTGQPSAAPGSNPFLGPSALGASPGSAPTASSATTLEELSGPMAISPRTVVPEGPGLPKGLPPGVAAGQERAAEGMADTLKVLTEEVAGAPEQIIQIEKAIGALDKTEIGRGSNLRNEVMAFITDLPGVRSIEAKAIKEAKDDVAAFDVINKVLQRIAEDSSLRLGTGTNAKLASAVSSNASTKISELATREILQVNLAMLRYKKVQLEAFDNSGLPASEYRGWLSKWTKSIDPRAFILDNLDKSQIDSLKSTLTPDEKRTLIQSHQWLRSSGYLDRR